MSHLTSWRGLLMFTDLTPPHPKAATRLAERRPTLAAVVQLIAPSVAGTSTLSSPGAAAFASEQLHSTIWRRHSLTQSLEVPSLYEQFNSFSILWCVCVGGGGTLRHK